MSKKEHREVVPDKLKVDKEQKFTITLPNGEEIIIKLNDKEHKKQIEVIDDGVGMDFEEINDKFLRIGRKRRDEGDNKSPSGIRKVTGRKGLGKLAFFGIGDLIEIITIKVNPVKKLPFR